MTTSTNRVRRARLEHGWTITQLAERAGLTRTTIIDAEHSRRSPRRRTVRALSTALDVPAATLWPEIAA